MVIKTATRKPKLKRFSVSLELDDYKRLVKLAHEHQPRLSLQYVVEFAVQGLLKRAKDPQTILELGDPLGAKRLDGK